MKKRWFQWEKIIKVKSNCDSCPHKARTEEAVKIMNEAALAMQPQFFGVIKLRDGDHRVFVSVEEKAL